MYFYKIIGQDMSFELGIQVWKIMSFRWRPSSWMQFSILRLKSSIARANSCWSIVSTSCRMASFNSFKLRGLWVYTLPFRYPQRKKSHGDKSGDLGGHGTSPKREMRRPGNMFRRTFIGACAVWRWGYKPCNLNKLKGTIRQEVLTIDVHLYFIPKYLLGQPIPVAV